MLHRVRMLMLFALVVLAIAGTAQASGNEVEFHGTVLGVTMRSATEGTLMLRVMGLEVPVRLTGNTEIEAHGDEVGLRELTVGDFVKVSGVFTNSTIVAKEIEIVDRGDGEFRLRGAIASVRVAAAGTIIKVLGIDVMVNSDTKIERRGPDGGFTTANLAAGLMADVRGHHLDGQFVASRLKVGPREDDAIRVAFSGKIAAVGERRLTVDTEGGSTAVVLITTSTVVTGTPAIGRFVEVRGTLNSNLEVVASRIVVKATRDSEEPPPVPLPIEFVRVIALTPVTPAEVRGVASVELEREDGRIEQEFTVRVAHGTANTEYKLQVEINGAGWIDFGSIRTNSEGGAEVKYSTQPHDAQRDLRPLLPTGKTVKDFMTVQVSGGTVVLKGTF